MSSLIIFLIIGGIGFLFLAISVIVGDLFEAFDFGMDLDSSGDFGVFDSRVVSVFLTTFGFVGAIAVQLGFGPVIAIILGLGSGVVLGALVFAFGYFLYSQQASSSVGDKDLVGRSAQVVVGIREGSIGKISCRIGDERIEKIARAANGGEIAEGKTVFIEEVTGDAIIVSSMDEQPGYQLISS
ncbi:MAG: hypothetical protein KIS76_05055 [Pyrinomonadaceae bacterium]|nr:hypothetical protein [Pyrinomonadaceae bacterium]